MATKKKMLEAAAGSAGGAALNVEDVFSAYTYDGNSTARTITNGIDLAGKGGMVLIKARGGALPPLSFNTDFGATKYVATSSLAPQYTELDTLTAFNSDGFDLDIDSYVNSTTMDNYISYTFRKAPRFFDCITYTGTGSPQTIAHNLQTTVGCIMVKRLDALVDWAVWHRSMATANLEYSVLKLNTTDPVATATSYWNATLPTTTGFTVGTDAMTNELGATYVAYLFAHNTNGSGEFGENQDQDIIACGSFNGVDGTDFSRRLVNIGFEPQFVMVKRTDSTSNWDVFDYLTGLPATYSGQTNNPAWSIDLNSSAAETDSYPSYFYADPRGFRINSANVNSIGANYIFIAIRRGPMANLESASDFFALEDDGSTLNSEGLAFTSNFPVDFALMKERTNGTDGWYVASRMCGEGTFMKTNSSNTENTGLTYGELDHHTGWYIGATPHMSWMWRKRQGAFDSMVYGGLGGSSSFYHNLGVVPEMFFVKKRNNSGGWYVYHKDLGNAQYLALNTTDRSFSTTSLWNSTNPTSSTITLGGSANDLGSTYLCCLFATLEGVSKVGSYTGNGTSQVIDCGFSNGARFVLIKRTDTDGTSWQVMDTVRGITTADDPRLQLESVVAESTGSDVIDPNPLGFEINNGFTDFNASGGSYIFYAIA